MTTVQTLPYSVAIMGTIMTVILDGEGMRAAAKFMAAIGEGVATLGVAGLLAEGI